MLGMRCVVVCSIPLPKIICSTSFELQSYIRDKMGIGAEDLQNIWWQTQHLLCIYLF